MKIKVRKPRFMSVLLVACLAGCSLLNKVAESVNALEEMKVVDNLEPSEQYYLGRGVSAVIVDRYKPIEIKDQRSERQIQYLNEMSGFIEIAAKDVTRSARKLGDYTDRSFDEQERVYNLALYKGIQVGVLDSDEVAAYATPGGFLWISRGLINMCNNEDELAAVVAHETAHIILDHGMANYRRAHKQSIITSTLSETWFSGSGVGANFGRLCVTLSEDLFNGYNPGQEFEADNWGTRALAASGYAPDAMVAMLKRIEQHEKDHKVDPEAYLAHHPPIGERIKAVQDLIKQENLKGNTGTMTPDAIQARNKRFEAAFK
ncbi:MAG: Beta-barrel assembly-enhancing protease [Planctomycetes bacterium]|nr:Beta-barrel assembly-enhancing protease [Planctomycetota bacterium]MCZ7606514.1 M48 family metallopeptidase [Planctomycetota bacterium]